MKKTILTPIKIENRYQVVQKALKQYIVDSGLKPGDRLPTEHEIAQSLGVSRSSLREALKGLQSLGIIDSRRGGGMVVRSFNFDAILDNLSYALLVNGAEVLELLHIRKALECYFIDQAILHQTPVIMESLREILERFAEKVKRNDDIRDVDEQFHITLFEPVRNRVLIRMIHLFWKTMNAIRDKSLVIEPDLEGSLKRHQDILRFFIERNVDAARKAMEIHFESPEKRFNEKLNQTGEDSVK